MKNKYKFLSLLKEENKIDSDNQHELFFKMFSLVQKGEVKFSTTSIDKLDENLPEGIYYIAHKLVTNKGKLLILKGDIVISRKENIILFLKESIAYEDLRNFLIYPTHNNQQPFVIDVSEDALFNIYR